MMSAANFYKKLISKKPGFLLQPVFVNFWGIMKHTYRQEDENFSKSRPFFFSFDFPYKIIKCMMITSSVYTIHTIPFECIAKSLLKKTFLFWLKRFWQVLTRDKDKCTFGNGKYQKSFSFYLKILHNFISNFLLSVFTRNVLFLSHVVYQSVPTPDYQTVTSKWPLQKGAQTLTHLSQKEARRSPIH